MKVFLDSCDPAAIEEHQFDVDGFTTNPTLMRRAGVDDYLAFAKRFVAFTDKPVCLEVLADDFKTIERQGRLLSDLGENVYVKVPVSLSNGAPLGLTLVRLANYGVRLNVTALMVPRQVEQVLKFIGHATAPIVSVFAGRIADTGRDPTSILAACAHEAHRRGAECLWASAREALNVKQAAAAGCDVITLTPELLVKMRQFGKSLDEVSLETVRQFVADGAGYSL